MPLTINAALTGAGRMGHNKWLQNLYQLVVQYNQLSPKAGVEARADLLHLIVRLAGSYLTSKPPQNKEKNKAKWEAIKLLLEQVGPEAQKWGLRMLSGPTDWKQIGSFNDQGNRVRSYWLELLDPLHRPGYKLASQFATWLTSGHAVATKESFWNYIGSSSKEATGAEFQTDVGYLNAMKDGNKKFLIEIHGTGYVSEAISSDYYCTKDESTVFSGKGWAIWVCSPTGEVYAGSHIEGKLHHSSFLGGRPVMAAGEMCVDDEGTIAMITAKSGHYTPSPEDLLRFVNAFPGIPARAIIRPNMLEKTCFYVGDFRTSGMQAAPRFKQQVLNALPNWARTTEVLKEYDGLTELPPRPPRNNIAPPRPPRLDLGERRL